MPGTFRAAVAAEMGQAFSPPYQVPIVVAVNGLLMAGAWFLLPRGWLFTLQSALAFPVALSSWMCADVPATNVLGPDRIRVLEALGDRTMISRLLLAKTAVLWVFVAPLCAVLALVAGLEHHATLLIGAEIIAICVVPVALPARRGAGRHPLALPPAAAALPLGPPGPAAPDDRPLADPRGRPLRPCARPVLADDRPGRSPPRANP